ncbi:MAG: MFS transporter [Eubacteriaceae bacterium]|nr:MFS transporter [Eubacteriaceae bacterium]
MDYEKYRKSSLITAVFTAFMTTFVASALNLSIPNIESDFSTNAVTVGWIVTIYTVSAAIFSVPFGKLADVIGKRKVLIGGVFVFMLTSVICAFSTSIQAMIIIRFFQGIGAACIFATNNAILISVYPGNRRGAVIGMSVSATYIGLSAGPVIGGFLNSSLGWRAIFWVACILSLISLYFTVTGTPADEGLKERQKTDMVGNILYVLMVSAFLFGFSNIGTGFSGKLLTLLGAVLLIVFGRYELKAVNPVVKISMFTGDAVFTLSNIAALLNYAATFAVTYLVSIYLQLIVGFPSQKAGLVLIIMPLIQALITPKTGKLSDTVPPYKLASAGMACCALGLGLFASLGKETGVVFVVVALMVMGTGFGLFSSPNTNAIMSRADKSDYAVANSIVSTMRTIGQSFSMALVNIIVSFKLGDSALSQVSGDNLISTIRTCFIVFLFLCIVGTLISLKRGEKRHRV